MSALEEYLEFIMPIKYIIQLMFFIYTSSPYNSNKNSTSLDSYNKVSSYDYSLLLILTYNRNG